MKFESMRNSLIGSAFVVLGSALLASCGGGGASSPGPVGGPPQVIPASGTLYAGVEYTIAITGGRPPYTLGSSEPALLPVPTTLNGNFFTTIPNNNSVVDSGLEPGSLPVRSVTITMRDAIGSTAASTGLQVAPNYFTGYGATYQSTCTVTTAQACTGGETLINFLTSIAGNRYGGRTYRFDIIRGSFTFIAQAGGVALGNTVTTTTDHEGNAHVWLRVTGAGPSEIAAYRITDLATGVSTTQTFLIQGVPATPNGSLTILPDSFTFTGPNTAQCGTGTGDFLVFDGLPPYRATVSNPNLQVVPEVSNSQPGRFTLAASNPFVCLTNTAIVVTDANNSRGTVEVTTNTGSGAPPPNPIATTPGAITLVCGQSGSLSITGGPTTGGTFTVSRPGSVGGSPTTLPDERLTATVTGRNITVTRRPNDAAPGVPPGSADPGPYTFTVTDSANTSNTTTFSVNAPATCP